MKKEIKKILLTFLIVCIFSLTSCAFSFTSPNIKEYPNENEPQKTSSDGDLIIDGRYGIIVNDVPSYTEIDNYDVATIVSDIVMPATVEITCTVYFTYTYSNGFFWYGGGARTVSSSESCRATGFFINEDGYLLTNAHVITVSDEDSYPDLEYTDREITINYADSSKIFKVSVVAYDVNLDLAILKLDSAIDNLKYVKFLNLTNHDDDLYKTSDAVRLYYGEYVVAIGNANGYGICVTTGVVSAPYRTFQENGYVTEAIQTDAAINEGNSGGPLCNKYASVIGINTFKIESYSTDNLGFAIPSNVIIKYIDFVNASNSLNIKYYVTNERSYEN